MITLLTFLALLAPARPTLADAASGTVITVDTVVDENNNNGNCSLREAVRAANMDSPVDACPAGNGADTISLGAGIYQLSISGRGENEAATGDLDIREDLVIQGQGREVTFVDGGDIDRVFHIYYVNPAPIVRFEHLTIQNGYIDDLSSGGGIRNEGTLTLSAVSLLHNEALFSGSDPAVGGGLYNLGTATLWNASIIDNIADDGGGIFNDYTLFVYRSTLNNNRANKAEGGALDNYLGTATLEDVTISGNQAFSSGGGIFSDGTLWIYNSTLSNNTASDNGGALVNGYIATLENVTISGNSASFGGGVYNSGNLDITNGTIVENSILQGTLLESPKGANIENDDSVQIQNSMVALGQPAPNCAGLAELTSLGHNLEDTNTCDFDDPDDLPGAGDPNVDVLAENGGPTWTHALIWPSLAIDHGDDLACPTTDQRGALRAGDHCDIGAYEYDGVIPEELVFLPLIMH